MTDNSDSNTTALPSAVAVAVAGGPAELGPRKRGRPRYLIPTTATDLSPFLLRDPAPNEAQVAAELGIWRQRLGEWAELDPDLAAALKLLRTRYEARCISRLDSEPCTPNAMFLLKALHGYRDRDPSQVSGPTLNIKIVIDRGLIDVSHQNDTS